MVAATCFKKGHGLISQEALAVNAFSTLYWHVILS